MPSLKAIGELKCPRCRKGKMFSTHPYHPKESLDMNETCSVCGLKFEIEPGFFFGAMYISYAITVAWMIAVWLFFYVIFGEIKVMYISITVAVTIILLIPYIFRYGRAVFLHVFGGVRYDESYSK